MILIYLSSGAWSRTISYRLGRLHVNLKVILHHIDLHASIRAPIDDDTRSTRRDDDDDDDDDD